MSPNEGPPNGILVKLLSKKKSPIQTVVIGLFFFSRICLGLPKFRLEVLRLGTLRICEKIISIKIGCPVTVYILNERSRDVSSKCPIFYIRKTCNAPFTHLILKRRWWSILKISNHSKSGAFGVKSTFLVFDTKQRPKMKSIDFGPFGRKI